MKRTLLLTFLLLVFIENNIAQKIINEAVLKYDVTMRSSSNSKQFENTSLNVFLKGKQSRAEVISSLGNEISIFDSNAGKGAIIKEYSGQKLLILLTRDNWNARNNQFRQLTFKESGELKKINAYQCHKATAVLSNNDQLTVYYSPEYLIANNDYSYAFPGVKGMPVEFELTSGDIIFSYKLKEINFETTSLSNSIFELPKSGNYRTMSYEEATQLKKKD